MSLVMNGSPEPATKAQPKSVVPAVVFDDVVKTYPPGNARAVDGVSFEVQEGELLVLLGPSGCGKTTSLRLIAGLEEPERGTISIAGEVVCAPAKNLFVRAEKRNIGMVFQSYAIWPHMSVFENVAYPLRVRRVAKRQVREKVAEVLEAMGLADLAERSATKLSGGQQQRVALARSLVFEPRLLLFDEPLSNLDAKLRTHMRTEIKQLQQRTSVGSVFVTHDQAESMALADRIIVMNKGKIEQVGSPTDIYEHPKTQFVAEFIGSSNLFDGEVVGLGNGEAVQVRLRDTEQNLVCRSAAETFTIGQQVFVVVRPENLRMSRVRDTTPPAMDSSDNTWECEVQTAVYYGDRREYRLQVRDSALEHRVLNVTAASHVVFEPHEQVYVSCSSRDLMVARRSD